MKRLLRWTFLTLGLFACTAPAFGQSYIDQTAVEGILTRRAPSLEMLPEVYYNYYVFGHPSGNSVLGRHAFYKEVGNGDIELGRKRSRLVELLNRVLLENAQQGDTLVVPTQYGLDFRAYSPFPRYYPGARSLKKLFIIHKTIQAWAAYEYGKLVRWGVVNTGAQETPTPSGRYSFNWKQEFRISTMSPPGEEWKMYWVVNFYHARGMHVHQYAFPTGGPTSHGCVRLIDADARWVYQWADTWNTTEGNIGPWSAQGKLLDPGNMVLVLGQNPEGLPRPYIFKRRYPVLRVVDLPENPWSVPAGSPMQRRIDQRFFSEIAAVQ